MEIPLFHCHTGEHQFNVLKRFLDALLSDHWRHALISVFSNGARNMTGRVQALVTRLKREVLSRVIGVWYGLHQLELVMQRVFKQALEDEFYSTLTALIGHRRHQQNLIAEIRSNCPKFADTRWTLMLLSTTWIGQHPVRLMRDLNEKQPNCTHSKCWWIFKYALNVFALEAKAVFSLLHDLNKLVAEQRSRLSSLIEPYCQISEMQGSLDEDQITDTREAHTAARSGSFVLTHEHARSFLDEIGMWVIESLEELDVDDVCRLVSSVATLFVSAADGIANIACERDAANAASDEELPPVLPAKLSRIDMRLFVGTLQTQQIRMKRKYSDESVDDISQQLGSFLRAYREEELFKAAVLQCEQEKSGFTDNWAVTSMRFPLLQEFCGGLTIAFPNTVTVESDLSILG